jgi:ATP phosphoribosyltransferase regulatory subunit
MDLRQLHGLLPKRALSKAIRAAYVQDAALDATIIELRKQGQSVVIDLLGKAEYGSELNCDRELVLRDGKWVVVEMKN